MDTNFFDARAGQWDAHQARVQRAKKIYHYVADEITLNPHDRVLDFGCGTGLLGFCFIDSVKEVTFADTSAGMLEEVCKKAASFPTGAVKTINLTEHVITGVYNTIVSLMALHHVEDLDTAICSLADHVAPGGFICFSDLDVEDGSFHAPDIAPHNGIDRALVLNNLEKSGMHIICNKTVHTEEKIIDGKTKTYPIFLIIGRRN